MPIEGVNRAWGGAIGNDIKTTPSTFNLDIHLGGRRPTLVREAQNNPPVILGAFSTADGQDTIVKAFEVLIGIDPASTVRAGLAPTVATERGIAFTSAPVVNMIISSSISHTPGQKRHPCAICPRSFDRIQRALDCANKDLGLKPYACEGRCKKSNWYVVRSVMGRH